MRQTRYLSHVFVARFSDGTNIRQTPEDVSSIDPTRSAFYDVVQRLDDVVSFTLYAPNGESTTVDLRTGLFDMGKGAFWVGDPSLPELTPGTPLRLIYFRRVRIDFDASGDCTARNVTYYMGWQATDEEGRNRQHTIAIEGAD